MRGEVGFGKRDDEGWSGAREKVKEASKESINQTIGGGVRENWEDFFVSVAAQALAVH